MRGILSACALYCGFLTMPEAEASVQINIDLSSQTMHVSSASVSYDWRVSTARSGYRTPRGTYRPYMLQRTHFSHKYHMSPMPYSIFFAGGYAIHGTYSTGSLAVPPRMGAFVSHRVMPSFSTTWCKPRVARSPFLDRRQARAMRAATASLVPPSLTLR